MLLSYFSLSVLQGLYAEEVDLDCPSAESLYRYYIEANGGYLNLESLSSIAIKACLKEEGGKLVDISIYRKRSNKLRLRTERNNYSEELIYNGREGWRELSSPQGYQIELKRLQPEEMDRVQKLCRMEGPFFLVGRNEKNISLIKMDEVAGAPAYRIEVNPESGSAFQTIWLDANSFQEVKTAQTLEREGSPVLEEVYYDELTNIDGHAFHLKQTLFVDGVYEGTLTVESIRINIGIYDNYFSVDSISAVGGLN